VFCKFGVRNLVPHAVGRARFGMDFEANHALPVAAMARA